MGVRVVSYISVGGKPRQFEITDPDKRIVAGFASVEIKDSHGEIVPVDELKRAMYEYMERGGLIMYGHQSLPVGKVLRWEIREDPDTGKPGVWIEAIIGKGPIEDEIWKRVKEGEIVGFSIGGVGGRRTTKDEHGEPVKEIVELGLYEISLVEEPANPEAKIEEINYYAKAKESEKSKCKKRYLVEEKGGGSHFKEMTCPDDTSRKSRFCGCVRYFINCEKKSLESAKKLCAYIYHQKYGKSESIDWLIEMAPHMVEKSESELELVFKPFAGFKDFDECLDKMREQYGEKYSGEELEEVARKVCGKLYWEHEGKKKKGEGEEMLTVEKEGDIDLSCLKRYTWRDEDGNTHYEAIKCNRVKELIKERPSFKDKEMPFCGCIKAKMECEKLDYEDARNICAWMFFARDKAEKGSATPYKAGENIVPEDVEKAVHEPESKVNEIGSEEKEEEEVEKKEIEVEVESEAKTESEAKAEAGEAKVDDEKEFEVGEKIGATEEVVEGIKEELGELKEKISKLEKLLADLASEVEKLIISGEDTISGGAEPMSEKLSRGKGRKVIVVRKRKSNDEKIELLKERIRRKLMEKLEKAEYKPKAEKLDVKDVAGPRIEGDKIVEEVKELKKQIEELKKLLAEKKTVQERRPVRKKIIVRRKVKKSEDGTLKAETPRPDVTEAGGETKATGGATFKDLLLKGLQGDQSAWQKLIGAVKEYEMTVRPEFASLKPFTEDKKNK